MTLLDERTREQLHNLAAVVTEYTDPARIQEKAWPTGPDFPWENYQLSKKQQDRACYLRRMYRWHSRAIAEAMNLAKPPYTNHWEPSVTLALEECATRNDWNSQGWRLGPQEVTWHGPSTYSRARQSLMLDAIATVLAANPTMPSKTAAIRGKAIVDNWKSQGIIEGDAPRQMSYQTVNHLIRDMEQLGYTWEGAGRTQKAFVLPDDIRTKIEAEILRRCTEDLEAGGVLVRGAHGAGRGWRKQPINYAQIAREINAMNVGMDSATGQEATLEELGYEPMSAWFVRQTCIDGGITEEQYRYKVAEEAGKKENIEKIQTILDAHPDSVPGVDELRARTGLSHRVVRTILVNMGVFQGVRRRGTPAEYQAIVDAFLAGHKAGLTIYETIDQYPVILKYYVDRPTASSNGIRMIREAGLTVITRASRARAARIPGIVQRIQEAIFEYMPDAYSPDILPRVQGQGFPNPLRWTGIQDLAEIVNSPAAEVQLAVEALQAEPRPWISLSDDYIYITPQGQQQWHRASS